MSLIRNHFGSVHNPSRTITHVLLVSTIDINKIKQRQTGIRTMKKIERKNRFKQQARHNGYSNRNSPTDFATSVARITRKT